MTKDFFMEIEADLSARRFLTRNPVLTAAQSGELSPTTLAGVILQYVFFPARIVRLLTAAGSRLPPESGVREELDRNVSEELGSETGGVPHVRILLILLSRELDLRLGQTRANTVTNHFLQAIDDGMNSQDEWYALGQAFALEASAVPELSRILGPALNTYAAAMGLSSPVPVDAMSEQGAAVHARISSRDEALAMNLGGWIAMHTQHFEVGHRDRLRDQILSLRLDEESEAQFRRGFHHVLDEMDVWWEALAR